MSVTGTAVLLDPSLPSLVTRALTRRAAWLVGAYRKTTALVFFRMRWLDVNAMSYHGNRKFSWNMWRLFGEIGRPGECQ